jgi:Na+/melibiose symporter-like transporter
MAGLAVSHWYGGTLQGYGVVLLISIVLGIAGLGCQYFQVDMNPRLQNTCYGNSTQTSEIQPEVAKDESSEVAQSIHPPQSQLTHSVWKNSNFLRFLLYFSFWNLAVNLSSPFFNLYMLDTLDLDVIYNSLQAGATLLMLILWGKLADKIGNRPNTVRYWNFGCSYTSAMARDWC